MSDLTQEFVNVFCEFIEAVIHQILHLRRIYRPELFERHRLYGITTRKSRHPDLNEYTHSIATSIKARGRATRKMSTHQDSQAFSIAGRLAARTAAQDCCKYYDRRWHARGTLCVAEPGIPGPQLYWRFYHIR